MKKKFEDYHRDYERRKEHIRDEAVRKTRSLTEDNRQLQKELGNKRQEAQVLVEEMEYTTQAFEEMQEQNIRLLQQLKVGVAARHGRGCCELWVFWDQTRT